AGAAKIRGAVARAETIEQVQELFDQAREAYQERIAK
ncbi:tRNA dihydrouridine synthase DusB, partial [Streptococcus suis]